MTGTNTTEETSEVPQFTIYIASMPGQYTVSVSHIIYMYMCNQLSDQWCAFHAMPLTLYR